MFDFSANLCVILNELSEVCSTNTLSPDRTMSRGLYFIFIRIYLYTYTRVCARYAIDSVLWWRGSPGKSGAAKWGKWDYVNGQRKRGSKRVCRYVYRVFCTNSIRTARDYKLLLSYIAARVRRPLIVFPHFDGPSPPFIHHFCYWFFKRPI